MSGPIEVDIKFANPMLAWLVTEDNIQQVADWCGGVTAGERIHFLGEKDVGYGAVGEYVMKGDGNCFSVSPKYFRDTYVARRAETDTQR